MLVCLPQTVNYVERDGTWHHLAVTWQAANQGLTQIYYDGMLSESWQRMWTCSITNFKIPHSTCHQGLYIFFWMTQYLALHTSFVMGRF